MKIKKIILLIIAAVFLFSAAGFCDVGGLVDNDQHCASCCSAGCHTVVLPSRQAVITPAFSTFFILLNAALRQEPFVGSIECPPKNFI